MNLKEIASLRLVNQKIAGEKFKNAKDLLNWMGVMQAQDYAASKWAVGVRLLDPAVQKVEAALNNGEILRTHLLRPTWHLVSAENIYWMLELTAPRIKASMKSRLAGLGLSDALLKKSKSVMEKILRDGTHLTRDELGAAFEKAGIPTDNNRASHIFVNAELDGLICSGAEKSGAPTYALLEERVPKKKTFSREESLAMLAKIYFTSHGPATLQDFSWWSGLTVRDAKSALEMMLPELESETVDAQTYFADKFSGPENDADKTYLLPAFDEFIISYQSRSASIPIGLNQVVSSNGIFWPVVVVNGQVTGKWKRTFKKDICIVELELFKQSGKSANKSIDEAAGHFGDYLGKKVEIKYKK